MSTTPAQQHEPDKLVNTVGAGFARYADFSGRTQPPVAGRWLLFALVLTMIAVVLDEVFHTPTVASVSVFGGLSDTGMITAVTGLILLLPTLAILVRRLHDIDKSGWWLLVVLIPVIGWLVMLSFVLQNGTAGANRFGRAPVPPAST